MSTATVRVGTPLEEDRRRVETELGRILSIQGESSSAIQKAMEYAVMGPGQRIRPILALRIARLAGQEGPHTLRAAAAVELLHSASLIVDDLPCMDDEKLRRGRPCVHVAYGEPTALLAAFGLVALTARSVVEQRCTPTEISRLIQFQCALLGVVDVSGLCEGQDLDLKLTGPDRERFRKKVIELKTVPLFELSAQAGLLFLNPESPLVLALRRFAHEFGVAFQLADDYIDGEITSLRLVEEQIQRAASCLNPIRPAGAELDELLQYLHARCLAHSI